MIVSYLAGGSLVTIEFDATMREGHESHTTVTEYHVERGANPADHARPENDKFTADVCVTNTPIRVPATNRNGVNGGFSSVDLHTETIPNFPRVLPGVGLAASFLPRGSDTTAVEVLNFNSTDAFRMDRVQVIYNELHRLETESVLVNISTPLREYSDMLLRQLTAPRSAADGSSMTFSFTAAAVRFVDSEIVAVKADVTAKKQKGPQPAKETTPQDKESVAFAGEHGGVKAVLKTIGISP